MKILVLGDVRYDSIESMQPICKKLCIQLLYYKK